MQEGYTAKPDTAYHGYYFKILKAQGPAAPMGKMDFVVEGAMIGGFALAGAPADYRVTGVKTFVVGANGKVYEKDLGDETLEAFQAMDRYNPDKTWQETSDDVDPDNSLKDCPRLLQRRIATSYPDPRGKAASPHARTG